MQPLELSLRERLARDAELLNNIAARREREGDPGIFSSVERQIVVRAWLAELPPDKAAELERINSEISASEQALRNGSIPAVDAALWHADWVAEKILFELEVERSVPRTPKGLARMEAHTESGVYSGLVVGETSRHVVQQLPGRGLVAHRKENLERSPRAGESVTVRYSNGLGTVRETHVRGRGREMSRDR